ncbi:TPA: hypothetical protein RJN57_005716 [Pseudomonas aeruginosa]|nr:hypothetical protein [Pseudomonas aeruginosa]HDV6148609.1 hypothetical protein [Pseudomonas aeruginosa]HDV6166610.1 hypothetical protein [Pseudomonas aeruginosa]
MIDVASLETVIHTNLEGDGQNFGGKGFHIPAGFSQTIERCRAINMGGEPMYFEQNAGCGANIYTRSRDTLLIRLYMLLLRSPAILLHTRDFSVESGSPELISRSGQAQEMAVQ